MRENVIHRQSTAAVENDGDWVARQYWLDQLEPLNHFIKNNRTHHQLKLSDEQLRALSALLKECLGVSVDFFKSNLSVMELLDLVLSLFLNTSQSRSQVLCTTSGTLRTASCRVNDKLNANNRAHAVFIAIQTRIIKLM